MFSSIFMKSLYSMRWHLLGWSVILAFFAFATMALFPSFSQDGIEDLVKSVPPELQSLFGDVDDFKTIPGYIGQQIFGPNLYILSLIMAIIIFLGISASEESDGRLQTLLSYPVSRTKIYLHKLLAASVVVSLVTASIVAGIALALPLIDETANFGRIWQTTLALGILNLAYGFIVFATAMFTGSKGWTIVIASGYTAASIFITSLAPAVDALEIPNKLSLLNYYNDPQIMTEGLEAGDIGMLCVVALTLIAIGWIGFVRRDVRTN